MRSLCISSRVLEEESLSVLALLVLSVEDSSIAFAVSFPIFTIDAIEIPNISFVPPSPISALQIGQLTLFLETLFIHCK